MQESFKKNGLRPHKSEYWIFPKIDDECEFVSRLEEINRTYQEAAMPESIINVVSSDEKTGIQALCHLHTQKAKPGKVERKDPEYVRNGTSSLIAALNVKTGLLQNYSLGGPNFEFASLIINKGRGIIGVKSDSAET